jgi:integrase
LPKSGTPLSATLVRNLKEPGKYYDLHGLFLRIEPTGSRRWVQRLTIYGRQREIGLGPTELVSLAEAREAAHQNKRIARAGGDPLAEKRKSAAIPSFAEAIDRVIELHGPTWTNPKHAAQFRSTLETYACPKLGRRPVSEIDASDILAALQPIWVAKHETARRLKQRIGTVMKWAVAQGFRSDDPTTALNQVLPRPSKKPEHRKSITYAEVANCIAAVRQSDAMQSTKLAFEFLVLTAARSGEVRGATWNEIDFDNAVWVIPGARMKMKVEHRVPLSARALAILESAKSLGDPTLVFPGSRQGRPMSDMTMSKLIKELGFDADIHGFRTSFRVWVQEQTSMPFEVAEKALAHKTSNKVVAAYARSDLFEKRRQLMDAWNSYLNESSSNLVRLVNG